MVDGSVKIMSSLTKVAVILPFNDLEVFHGGSRHGVKSWIPYFNQFLMLYESIVENWNNKYFEYQIIVLHSIDFSPEKQKILDSLDICVMKVNYDGHPLKIRPMAYRVEVECDFRLVMDVDMIALREPKFDFSFDAQAVYGGNKFNKGQWQKICRWLGCNMPSYRIFRIRKGNYKAWCFKEHYFHQTGKVKKKIFPYFNNGAILIKNSLSTALANTWERYRESYTKYIMSTEGVDIDMEGQDVIGLAINSVTDNWSVLPRGCNYALNEKFYFGRRMIRSGTESVSLYHYINLSEGNLYHHIINNYKELVSKKHFTGS